MVSRRCPRHPNGDIEPNGLVFDEMGRVRATLILGDGISDSQVSTDSGIWVAYSLTGTTGNFGELGWGRISPEEWVHPIGYTGLVRFDLQGNVMAEYAPPDGLQMMNDCFALNATGDDALCCYHPNFPIVRVSANGTGQGWSTELVSVEALAIDGDTVVAYSKVRGEHEIRVYRLQSSGAEMATRIEPSLSGSTSVQSVRWVGGRGTDLHAVTATDWYALSTESVVT
jgi:hypothetical protein